MRPLRLTTLQQTSDLFWPEFVVVDGAVFLAATPTPTDRDRFDSVTEFERFHSHTHLFDHVRHAIPTRYDRDLDLDRLAVDHPDHQAAWALAQRIGAMWAAKLQRDFPARAFRVYVTRLDDPVVHFHAVHPGERAWVTDAEAELSIAVGDLALYRTRAEAGTAAG